MDFFAAQDLARRRTARLVALFLLAVGGTIVAGYFATVLGLRQLGEAGFEIEINRRSLLQSGSLHDSLWHPAILAWVAAVTLVVVGVASLWKWHQFSAGGSAVAESVGGRRVDPTTTDLAERRLLNVVEEMAIASGTPVPAVFILPDEPAINAFAAGLTTGDAAVAVTRGTLEKLNRDELQGVVAHEFSHILNGDMRLNLRLAAVVFGILVIGLAGRGILWSLRHTRVRSSRDGKSGAGLVVIVALAGLALLLIGYVGYFFGRLIQAAVSRQREFLADASAVQFTRHPAGLAGALKKIAGYALGSSLQAAKCAEIGHFFFAQGFRASFGGLWATHPPLDARIRAVDPSFDGRPFAPPEVVDVARESFVSAGLAPAPRPVPASFPPVAASAALAAAGTITAAQLADAHALLDTAPAALLDAAHSRTDAPLLVCTLLLADEPGTRERQLELVREHLGEADAARLRAAMLPASAGLRCEHRLPLAQLALPVLRGLAGPDLARFLGALDELVHADGRVSPFEFALQKLLVRTLALGRDPAAALVRYQSFQPLAAEIAVVLSVFARTAVAEPAFAPEAFAAGARQLPLLAGRLGFDPGADLAALDAALDKLAEASLPIKQRVLAAAAATVGADGRILLAEAELLRAVAAALDIPLPPLAAAA